jgi:hypothetical protein
MIICKSQHFTILTLYFRLQLLPEHRKRVSWFNGCRVNRSCKSKLLRLYRRNLRYVKAEGQGNALSPQAAYEFFSLITLEPIFFSSNNGSEINSTSA